MDICRGLLHGFDYSDYKTNAIQLFVSAANRILSIPFTKNNVVQEKKFSDRLLETLRKYHNRALETAQVIEELIQMAKDFQKALERNKELGLNDDEIAFYDALANKESAVRELGNEILKKIAVELTGKLRNSTTYHFAFKENI